MTSETKTLATIGVDINITPVSAVYLLAVIVLGSLAFFVAKKYIR